MRILILSLAMVLGLMAVPMIDGGAASAVVMAQQAPVIDVDIDRGGGAWYANPVWIAIGVIALVVIVLLIVAASRGGGTTVVRG